MVSPKKSREVSMCYCRWSCDRFKSDYYVYKGEHGYVAHMKRGEPYCITLGTPGEMAGWLDEHSKSNGFHIPDHVIPNLREEQTEWDEMEKEEDPTEVYKKAIETLAENMNIILENAYKDAGLEVIVYNKGGKPTLVEISFFDKENPRW